MSHVTHYIYVIYSTYNTHIIHNIKDNNIYIYKEIQKVVTDL